MEFLEDTSRIEVEGKDDVEGPVGSVSNVDTKNWNEDDDEEEQVKDSYFTMASPHADSNHIYDDLFGLDELIKKAINKDLQEEELSDPIFPPGFTPDEANYNHEDKKTIIEGTQDSNVGSFREGSGDDVIEFGQAMGFDMKGCEKDMKLGRSGGILCVWDKRAFSKTKEFLCENFVAMEGIWKSSNTSIMIVSIYAPQYLGGYMYTWSNKEASKSKIDRFLILEGLLSTYPNLSGLILTRHLSDHRPLLLHESRADYGPTPFRMFPLCKEKVDDHKKLKKEISSKLCEIDKCIDNGQSSTSDMDNRVQLTKLLCDIDRKESIDLAQKAKVKWAIEGDENSKYFHVIINKKRCQLTVRGILVDGEWVDSPDRKRELEDNITLEEVKQAVWDCGSDKSSGPDGFTFKFFKTFWHLVGDDVFRAISYFFTSSQFPIGCNSFFVTLIPKVQDAKLVNEFRPIILIGCQYKIVGKILANRLSLVINDLVSIEQSAFIKARQILDGPFILNETISWCKNHNHKAVVLKFDFEKAYDSVRWDFLDGAEIDERKMTWISWKKVLAHKQDGGCNIRDLTRWITCGYPWPELEGKRFVSLIPLSRESFDVIVGMDWLSKRKFVIVCHEKVVRIPLEGDEILRVHGERTQGVVKTLMNTKVLLVGSVMDEAHASRFRWMIYLVVLADATERVRDAIGFEYCLVSSRGWTKKCRSHVLWAEIEGSSLIGPELVLETTDKVVLIKEKLKAARDCQKSYADKRRKPLEFEVGDQVLLKVSPWKGVVRFGKKGKLAPRYVGPFEILERIGLIAYRLRLPEELNSIKVNKTLHFVEEPVEIMDREIKKLKCRKIALVKVRWNSKRGPEFT
ncbi:RNA-directed DNA polymerase, eukaryota [Tanacetum coccineum]|uniref:RNA-directed DNA polymerase, eukaryota n=1 Tax=Tanacetum coccineum TaxID=301880 RepID=A0ABQ4WNC0_9ASTR